MGVIALHHVSKRYGIQAVVDRFDLEMADGEFIVLVGPSGCGKSTTLRMIAGLEDVSEGQIHIAGQDVTHLAPGERNIAMVFQNYALYPHKSVYENLAFGLRMRKIPDSEIREKVKWAAQMLNIENLLERKPFCARFAGLTLVMPESACSSSFLSNCFIVVSSCFES